MYTIESVQLTEISPWLSCQSAFITLDKTRVVKMLVCLHVPLSTATVQKEPDKPL